MASKSKSRDARKKSQPNQFSNLGLLDIPNLDTDLDMDEDLSDVDESTLENELELLMRGEAPTRRLKPKPKSKPPLDIEKLAAECLKDDYDDDDTDEDICEGELLKELQSLTPEISPSEELQDVVEEKSDKSNIPPPEVKNESNVANLLYERLSLYKEAEKVAKLNNDTSKARRYNRALKTIENLLKNAKAGLEINEEEIPPIVNVPKASPSKVAPGFHNESDASGTRVFDYSDTIVPSSDVKPMLESSAESNTLSTVSLLTIRQNQYKCAALQAKKSGDKDTALKYLKIAKTFDAVIQAANRNEPVDLTNLPPELPIDSISQLKQPDSKRTIEVQPEGPSPMEIAALAAADDDQSNVFSAPSAPSTILEALQQRLDKYNLTKQAAEAEGNSGKVRRLQRILKSYEAAIRDYKAGKEVNFEELPTPPGFAPIPVTSAKAITPNTSTSASNTANASNKQTPITDISNKKTPQNPVMPVQDCSAPSTSTKKPKIQRSNTSTAEKQLEFILERQKLFREAALTAKRNGDIQQAKEYLRMMKGFDSMVEAVKCGLPIDVSSIPTPPQLESDFVIVDVSDCNEGSDLTREELFETLEKDLCTQIEQCNKNKDHFLRLGDVSSASKFEKLALESKKDLCVVQHLKNKGDTAPKFHYETRVFSMVICNADLNDNDIEVNVKRGIQLPGKSDTLDAYIKIELPIPTETPQRAKTHTARDTNNPVYEEKFTFEINRKSRAQLRLFKRHSLKLEVWSKGGFLRSDNLLGTCAIKLIDLEGKCTIHDSFNLMDGRKACGGKLEVEVRIREPLLAKQVEEVREKWLVIGS